jgi:PTH1 family peptidyl-tRNA hydrolase
MRPWIIVGLGNPGPKYQHTPHNLGFEVLDVFAGNKELRFRRAFGLPARVAAWHKTEPHFRLLKPTTYMNRSGLAVCKALKRWKCGPEQLLVVFDDVELPLGTLRLKKKGGAGGHNGMTSIVQELDNRTDFARLRIGAGPRPSGDQLVETLLNPWKPELTAQVEELRAKGADALEIILQNGLDRAMNTLNQREDASPSN